MKSKQPFSTPSKVTPIEGEVVIEGPDGVGLSVTPAAAEITAARLWDAAETARGQSRESDEPDDEENIDAGN